jgi:hypothetical protein
MRGRGKRMVLSISSHIFRPLAPPLHIRPARTIRVGRALRGRPAGSPLQLHPHADDPGWQSHARAGLPDGFAWFHSYFLPGLTRPYKYILAFVSCWSSQARATGRFAPTWDWFTVNTARSNMARILHLIQVFPYSNYLQMIIKGL